MGYSPFYLNPKENPIVPLAFLHNSLNAHNATMFDMIDRMKRALEDVKANLQVAETKVTTVGKQIKKGWKI